MRFASVSVAFLAGLVSALPASSVDLTLPAASLITKRANSTGSISTASGLGFTIDGVNTPYYAGTNCYWCGFLTADADIDGVMVELKTAGVKVLRVWGFNDIVASTNEVWYQSFIPGQEPVINTGANGLERLDYVVQSAGANGIKLIVNFVNNWSDYGGMPAYNAYYNTTKTTWYTDAAVQAQYKAYIKAVVSRYPKSPAIFAWELANEPRCNGCATSIITKWITEISAYIKTLDPDHMITLGDEGFGLTGGTEYPYTFGEGLDFAANLDIPDIDFGTFHLYPYSWGGLSNEWGNGWVTSHAAACETAGKPCVFEEYGVTRANRTVVAGMWQTTSLNTKGMAGDMFWQFGTTLKSGTKTHDDGNTIYVGDADWEVLVVNHVKTINGEAVSSSASNDTVFIVVPPAPGVDASSVPVNTKYALGTAKPSSTVPLKTPVAQVVPILADTPIPSAPTTPTKLPAMEEPLVPAAKSSPTPSSSGTATRKAPAKPAMTTATRATSAPISNPSNPSSPPDTSSGTTVAKYMQCGGINHTGSVACVTGSKCTVMNEYYSQCI